MHASKLRPENELTKIVEQYESAVGKCIANLLLLKKDKDGRYKTAWGTKTALGLYRCIEGIVCSQRTKL